MEKLIFYEGNHDSLNIISECHESAFPGSLSTKLGRKYLVRMYAWYLAESNRFLYYTGSREKCTGFCGGILNSGSAASGSSSSMFQFTLSSAILGLLKNPFVIFHRDILEKLPFILKNILEKIRAKTLPGRTPRSKVVYKNPYAGLVVIGVSRQNQGQGIGSRLLIEFENRATRHGYHTLQLSVKQNNEPAIKSYQKNGWKINKELNDLYIFKKNLEKTEL